MDSRKAMVLSLEHTTPIKKLSARRMYGCQCQTTVGYSGKALSDAKTMSSDFLNVTDPSGLGGKSPIDHGGEPVNVEMGRLEALSAVAANSFPLQPTQRPNGLATMKSNNVSFIMNPAMLAKIHTSGIADGIEASMVDFPSPILGPILDTGSPTSGFWDVSSVLRNITHNNVSSQAKANFWNFVRQDFFMAFIGECSTVLDTADVELWKSAGLYLDEQGFIAPAMTYALFVRDEMASNALLWLASKIVSYIASGDSVDNVFPQDRTSPMGLIGINQMLLLERWKELEKELNVWHQGIPDTHKPSPTIVALDVDSSRATLPKIAYSNHIIATTMQLYHMVHIILLINRPHESTARRTTISSRLSSYRTIQREVIHDAREIIGISLGNAEPTTRVNSIQPLFVAGQCITDVKDCRVIIWLLRAIEADLGATTEYRVKQLMKDWGWDTISEGNTLATEESVAGLQG